ncbi:MAG TPA: UPF0280 family protein [Burkholderiales bacterium]|nr:UPF0280 family protein [Burkholderiales bacterium]
MAAVAAPSAEAVREVARSGPIRARLDDRRWHFQHGPIDLVVEAFGNGADLAVERGWRRFETVLEELVAELATLRRPVEETAGLTGAVARRMRAACSPFRERFITPMAAVAGAVADEVIAALGPTVPKAYVNNGGDIALHLAPGESLRVGVVADPDRSLRHGHRLPLDGTFTIDASMPVRGVATSGWRGRSWSLGIADSVTVLAASGAAADAAATMVANAVDVASPAIERRRACDVDDDTDLGERPVTVGVGPLSEQAIEAALANGAKLAGELCAEGLIWGAVLALRGRYRVAGGVRSREHAAPQCILPYRSDH